MKKYIATIIFILVLHLIHAQTCDIGGKPHYQFQDIAKILDQNKCNSCHHSGNHTTPWHYENYDAAFAISKCGEPIISKSRADLSLLIDKLNGGPTKCGQAMPLYNQKIPQADLVAIEAWITSGAPEFCIPEYGDIKVLLTNQECKSCHNQVDRWDFSSYQKIFIKPENNFCTEKLITKYNATESLLYQKLIDQKACGNNDNLHDKTISKDQLSKIRDWIDAGAPESFKVLPVSLTEFYSSIQKENEVTLQWVTSAEVNTSHFEIQYSQNGIDFISIGQRAATGQSTTGNQYIFTHQVTDYGFHYYRLKMIDLDQSFRFSSIRVEKAESPDEILTIAPIPILTSGICQVEWYPIDERERVKLLLVGITGNLYREYIIQNGINEIDVSGLISGVYYIAVEDYVGHRVLRKVVVYDR